MKKIVLFVFLTLSLILNAQQKLKLQNDKEVIEFQISTEKFLVKFKDEDRKTIQKQSNNQFTEISKNTAIIKTAQLNYTDFTNTKSALKNKFSDKVTSIEPVLIYKDGVEQVCNGELNVKTKTDVDFDLLLKKYNFTIKKDDFLTNQFLITIDNISTPELFALAEFLQKNKNIYYAEPNFIRFIKPQTTDPFYASQWTINNQGYFGGTIDADMDVDNAWNFSTGNGIKVAIIDEGVDLNHPDLNANLLPGYDATGGNSSGGPSNNDAHGTGCAGIVAAVANNNIGIVGVAYNSKIIPIRIALKGSNGFWQTNDNWISAGINFAVQNQADVLSNSWGGGSPSATITNAINNAVTNGRNGKGAVVLFATGNENVAVSYPATLPNVIAVGASSMCDQRKTPTSCDGESWWGSNYGTGIDVIAPGVKIYTTDISGSAGYDYGDYKSDFNGTSSACPNAAGVVALILSVNPNLTGVEARQYLETSTDKVTGYSYSSNVTGQANGTWNNEVGYGRINAMNAVLKALNLSITGNPTICTSTTNIYTIQNYANGLVTSWSCSSNLVLSNQTNNSVSVTANGSGNGTITATFQSGQTLTKNIWVGQPIFNVQKTNETCGQYRFVTLTITNMDIDASHVYDYSFINLPTGITYTKTSNNVFLFKISLNTYTQNYFMYTAKATLGCATSSYSNYAMLGSCPSSIISAQKTTTNEETAQYVVYPNPSSDILNISLIDGKTVPVKTSKITATLYDLNGNKTESISVINNIASLNVSNYKKGIYVLKIDIDGQTESHQVIIK